MEVEDIVEYATATISHTTDGSVGVDFYPSLFIVRFSSL